VIKPKNPYCLPLKPSFFFFKKKPQFNIYTHISNNKYIYTYRKERENGYLKKSKYGYKETDSRFLTFTFISYSSSTSSYLLPFHHFFYLVKFNFLFLFIYFHWYDRVLDRGCFLIRLNDEDTVSSMSSLRRLKMKLLGIITFNPFISFKFHF